MALKTKLTIIVLFLIGTVAKGQRHTNFFGHKYFLGAGAALPVSAMVKDRPSAMSNVKLHLDAQLNSYLMLGSSLSLSRFEMPDKFDNDGKTRDYFVNYGNTRVPVNGGQGDFSMHGATCLLHLKKYNRRVSYLPIGRYYAIVTGLSMFQMNIMENYQFYYSEYYGGVKSRYVSIENAIYKFTKFNIGFEMGKTIRFFSDNTFLTFSGTLLRSGTKSFSYDSTLPERFKHLGEIAVNRQLLFHLNFLLSVGI